MKSIVLVVSFTSVLIGLAITIGARRKWHFLLNPPKRLWIFPLWPYALMKGPRFNQEFFATYHFISGIIFVLIGVALFIMALLQL